MDSIDKAADKPTNTVTSTSPSLPPYGWVTLVERLAQEVNKSPTEEDAASTFESFMDQQQMEVLWNIVGA